MIEDKLQVATVPLLSVYPLMHDLLMVGYFWSKSNEDEVEQSIFPLVFIWPTAQ